MQRKAYPNEVACNKKAENAFGVGNELVALFRTMRKSIVKNEKRKGRNAGNGTKPAQFAQYLFLVLKKEEQQILPGQLFQFILRFVVLRPAIYLFLSEPHPRIRKRVHLPS